MAYEFQAPNEVNKTVQTYVEVLVQKGSLEPRFSSLIHGAVPEAAVLVPQSWQNFLALG